MIQKSKEKTIRLKIQIKRKNQNLSVAMAREMTSLLSEEITMTMVETRGIVITIGEETLAMNEQLHHLSSKETTIGEMIVLLRISSVVKSQVRAEVEVHTYDLHPLLHKCRINMEGKVMGLEGKMGKEDIVMIEDIHKAVDKTKIGNKEVKMIEDIHQDAEQMDLVMIVVLHHAINSKDKTIDNRTMIGVEIGEAGIEDMIIDLAVGMVIEEEEDELETLYNL